MPLTEYKPGQAFPGVIGRTFDVSKPAWPEPNRAVAAAPNVIFFVIDDTGFGHLGCYGSPISTPHMDALAADGLRYSNMHTTALCSPSRSCIINGRNHHSNHMSCITEGSTGYPGGDGYIPFENGFLSEILQQHGYNTYALGKWHLTPSEQTSAAGPYDRWPLGRGFERYYGYLGGDTHQYYPDLVYDNHQVDPPKTPEEGYILSPDLADKARAMIADAKQVAPDKPFFMYFAPGGNHAPHHAQKEWIDKYKGQFDDGWDAYRAKVFANQKELGIIPANTVLSRHDPDVQDWGKLSADERRLYARMMEVFAGFVSQTDDAIGQVVAFLKEIGEYDNTMIMVISDNGASAEGGATGSVNENKFFNNVPENLAQNLAAIDDIGGPKYYNHYPWGWTHAGNTPFRRWKRETYRGGVSDPFIVSWPKGIKAKGEIRHAYSHAIDMVPTVLDAANVPPPETIRGVTQSPIQGFSFAHTFDDDAAPTKHVTQYFEMFGHRSIYHDGWRAVCPVPGPSFIEAGMGFGDMVLTEDKLRELDAHGWELYDLSKDWSETTNVAAENPAKLIEMIALWYVEAGKYDVLPLDSRGTMRFGDERPQIAKDRKSYSYFPGTSPVPENAAVKVLNRPHAITAKVTIPDGGAEGVIAAQGTSIGGYALFVKDNKLTYVYNFLGAQEFVVQAPDALPAGEHELRFEFEPTGKPDFANGKGAAGKAQLYVDRKMVAEQQLPVTIPLALGLSAGVVVGADSGSPVMEDYKPPFAFTGTVKKALIDISGELVEDQEAKFKMYMARQ